LCTRFRKRGVYPDVYPAITQLRVFATSVVRFGRIRLASAGITEVPTIGEMDQIATVTWKPGTRSGLRFEELNLRRQT